MNVSYRDTRGAFSDGTMSTDSACSPTRGGLMVMSYTGGLRSRSVVGGRVPGYAMPTVASRIRLSLSTDKLPDMEIYSCCQRFKPLSPPPTLFLKTKRRRSRSSDTRLTTSSLFSKKPEVHHDRSMTKCASSGNHARGRSSSRNTCNVGDKMVGGKQVTGSDTRTGAGTLKSRGGSGSVTPSGPPQVLGSSRGQPKRQRGHSTDSFTGRKPYMEETSRSSAMNNSVMNKSMSKHPPPTRSYTSRVRTPSEENYLFSSRSTKTSDRKTVTTPSSTRSFDMGKSLTKHSGVSAHVAVSPRVGSGVRDRSANDAKQKDTTTHSNTAHSGAVTKAASSSKPAVEVQKHKKTSSMTSVEKMGNKSSVSNGVKPASSKPSVPITKAATEKSGNEAKTAKPEIKPNKNTNSKPAENKTKITKETEAKADKNLKEKKTAEVTTKSKPANDEVVAEQTVKETESQVTSNAADLLKTAAVNNGVSESSSIPAAAAASKPDKANPEVDEYKAKLAEKRRMAREKAEKEAEEKRLEEERIRREEEEREAREREEEARREAEELRQLEEARAAEQERYRVMVEAEEKRKKEEVERLEAELKLRVEKERIAKEEAERLEAERLVRMKREEEEKNERKKRLESIMKRVKGDETPTKTLNELPTPSSNDTSPQNSDSSVATVVLNPNSSEVTKSEVNHTESESLPVVVNEPQTNGVSDSAKIEPQENELIIGTDEMPKEPTLTKEPILIEVPNPLVSVPVADAETSPNLLLLNGVENSSNHDGTNDMKGLIEADSLQANNDLLDFGFSPKKLMPQANRPDVSNEGALTASLISIGASQENISTSEASTGYTPSAVGNLLDMDPLVNTQPFTSNVENSSKTLDNLNNEMKCELNGNINSARNDDLGKSDVDTTASADNTTGSAGVTTIASLLTPLDAEEKIEVKFKSPLLQQILGKRNKTAAAAAAPVTSNQGEDKAAAGITEA